MAYATKSTVGRMARKNWFIAGTAVFLILYLVLLRLEPSANGPLYWIAVAAAFVAFGSSFFWMRSLDEIGLSAQMQSWFWGGTLGLVVFAALLLAAAPHLSAAVEATVVAWRGHATPTTGFLLGMAVPLALQGLFTVAWWAAFWLRRR